MSSSRVITQGEMWDFGDLLLSIAIAGFDRSLEQQNQQIKKLVLRVSFLERELKKSKAHRSKK